MEDKVEGEKKKNEGSNEIDKDSPDLTVKNGEKDQDQIDGVVDEVIQEMEKVLNPKTSCSRRIAGIISILIVVLVFICLTVVGKISLNPQ